MNYKACYERLIARARARTLSGYSEKHHVIPKCLGGDNSRDNIVRLTPEEHYVAHQLLVKMHPHHKGLLWSAILMTGNSCHGGRSGNKTYGWLKRRFTHMQRGKIVSAETRARQSAAHKGKPLTAAQIAGNILRRGLKPNEAVLAALEKGRQSYPVARAEAISKAKKGKKQSDAHKAALSAVRKGRVHTQENRAAISSALKGIVRSPETRARMSIARRRVIELKRMAAT